MHNKAKFMTLVMEGQVKDIHEKFDDYVDFWHTEYNGNESLASFLGMTAKEYNLFIRSAKNIDKIIAMRKLNKC